MTNPLDPYIEQALPYSHWGRRYFDIRHFEYQLADSLFGDILSKGGDSACDIGCGLGFAAAYLRQYFSKVEGTDIDVVDVAFKADVPSAVVGQQIFEHLGSDVRLSCGDTVAFLTDRPEAFDLVFSHFVMEHVEHLSPLCEAAFAATKPGGFNLHIVPNTHDTICQLLIKNLGDADELVARAAQVTDTDERLDGRKQGHLYTPITHSEFIADYREQFAVNSIEHYLEPLMNAGFKIRDVKPMREHAYGVLAEKPA